MMPLRMCAVLFGMAAVATVSVQAADAPPAAMGRIYIARTPDPHVGFAVPVAIDGKPLAGGLAPGACLYVDLPPGAYVLRAMSDTDLKIDLAAGGAKYVTLVTKRTELGGGEMDEIVPELADDAGDRARCSSITAPS